MKTGAVVVIGVPMQVVDGRGDGADETADGLIRCLPHSQGNYRHILGLDAACRVGGFVAPTGRVSRNARTPRDLEPATRQPARKLGGEEGVRSALAAAPAVAHDLVTVADDANGVPGRRDNW